MKKLFSILILLFTSMVVFASDLVIESKTQTFSDKEKKLSLMVGLQLS